MIHTIKDTEGNDQEVLVRCLSPADITEVFRRIQWDSIHRMELLATGDLEKDDARILDNQIKKARAEVGGERPAQPERSAGMNYALSLVVQDVHDRHVFEVATALEMSELMTIPMNEIKGLLEVVKEVNQDFFQIFSASVGAVEKAK